MLRKRNQFKQESKKKLVKHKEQEMELKIASVVIFLCSVLLSYKQAAASKIVGIYSLRSAYRQKYQTTDCNLLKVSINSRGEPSGLTYKGRCCDHKKHKDFKVVQFVPIGSRDLTATFQWLHDTRYYLTAKTTGNQLALEKPGSLITDNHKFIVKSKFTPGCDDCITLQSKATNKYLVSDSNGHVSMTTNRKLKGALLRLHTCDPALLVLCRFIDISC